jgi:hypothetical protein
MATIISAGHFNFGVTTVQHLVGAANYIIDTVYFAPDLLVMSAAGQSGQATIQTTTPAVIAGVLNFGTIVGNNFLQGPTVITFPKGLVLPRGVGIDLVCTLSGTNYGLSYGVYGLSVP